MRLFEWVTFYCTAAVIRLLFHPGQLQKKNTSVLHGQKFCTHFFFFFVSYCILTHVQDNKQQCVHLHGARFDVSDPCNTGRTLQWHASGYPILMQRFHSIQVYLHITITDTSKQEKKKINFFTPNNQKKRKNKKQNCMITFKERAN